MSDKDMILVIDSSSPYYTRIGESIGMDESGLCVDVRFDHYTTKRFYHKHVVPAYTILGDESLDSIASQLAESPFAAYYKIGSITEITKQHILDYLQTYHRTGYSYKLVDGQIREFNEKVI